MILYEKAPHNSASTPYKLYKLEGVEDKEKRKIIEEIFKFDKGELEFVQQDVKRSFHYNYFANYFFYDVDSLNVKTIVIEKHYTCRTFLEDYINYYAHCYTKYRKNCRRIHLFNTNFDEAAFQNMLYEGNDNQPSKLQNIYLGCIVIKPLPKGIIGVTYLKTYNGDKEKNRYYTAVGTQTINLYGTTLKVDTMPFMEQDSNVGACASTALWMAFQKTSELFHTPKPSPSEITLLAGSDLYNTGKIFPNQGLDIAQICKAISKNGLHSELRYNEKKITNRSWLQGFVYAYIKAEIPILLGIEIEGLGSHLITLNGYRFNFDKSNKVTQEDFCYKSQYISRFYVHDDQTGPFSRLKFNKENDEYFLLTSWWKTDVDWSKSRQEIESFFKEEKNYHNCKPTCLIVPLDRKIKVPYEEVIDKIKIIKYLFSTFLNANFIWDIFLIKSNTYKEQIKKQVEKKENLRKLLYTSLPQYIWVAQAYVDGYYKEPIFDFIFDSVEMPYDGKPFLANVYSESFKNCLSQFNIQIQKLFSNDIENTVYKVLVENTQIMELIQKESESNQKGKIIDGILSELIQKDEALDNIGKVLNDVSNDMDKVMKEAEEKMKEIL